ncbi:MAG: hypothetical protein NTV17_05250, partial [Burkholderiales bacterium]|nr:hypothetical protein [Burkholderiales bacterium]
GLGNENSCPNDCSGEGKGVCTANTCACKPGFSGIDCSISLYNLPVASDTELITAESNVSVSAKKLTDEGLASTKVPPTSSALMINSGTARKKKS